MKERQASTVELTVVGRDRSGVVASFTNLIFKHGGNIESVNQNVVRGLFGMHLESSFTKGVDKKELLKEVQALGMDFGMEVGLHHREKGKAPNLAIMVTKENHCIDEILRAVKDGELEVKVVVVIGSSNALRAVAERNGLPFYVVSNIDQTKRETRIIRILQKHDTDFIALARYMRILGPNFVWRYPNKIINIHPSILPAFPGAYAYEQAYEKGARIIGCTAHFVTTDLDEGPIIWQEALQVNQDETLDSVKARGQKLEAKALANALRLYAEDRLEVRWGRVYIG
jgi:formyltetrahydrofolate deformylase